MNAARVAVLALFAAGCAGVTTTHPIGSSSGLKPDAALVGTWLAYGENQTDLERTEDGKVATYFHVLPAGKDTLAIVVVSLPKKSGEEGGAELYRAACGQAGDNHFLNIVALDRLSEDAIVHPKEGSVPVFYRFEATGDLALYLPDEDKFKVAVETGAIAGTVKKNKITMDGKEYDTGEDVVITAEPKNLDAFFAKPESVTLFEKKGLLKRAD